MLGSETFKPFEFKTIDTAYGATGLFALLGFGLVLVWYSLCPHSLLLNGNIYSVPLNIESLYLFFLFYRRSQLRDYFESQKIL